MSRTLAGKPDEALATVSRVVVTMTYAEGGYQGGQTVTEVHGPYATPQAARGRATALENDVKRWGIRSSYSSFTAEVETTTTNWKKDPA